MFFLYDTLISTGERWYNRRGMTVFYSCRELNHASSLSPEVVKPRRRSCCGIIDRANSLLLCHATRESLTGVHFLTDRMYEISGS